VTTPMQQAFLFAPKATAVHTGPRNLVIEAGAGTGKTSAIVAEVLRLLLENPELSPERIVLMTFTEKAAGEIADRIHEALAELELQFETIGARVSSPAPSWPSGSDNPLFTVPAEKLDQYRLACQIQLARVDSLRSQTIHSFCQSLLRAYPIEAGLDPQFKIIEGFERSLLYSDLYDAWLDEETRTNPTPETLRDWEFLLAHVGYLFQIRDLVFSLVSRRDLLTETGYDFGALEEIEQDLVRELTTIRRSDISRVTDDAARTLFRYIQQVDLPQPHSLDAWIEYFAPVAAALRKANLPKDRDLKQALATLRTDKDKGASIYDRLIRHRSATALVGLTRRFIDFLDREKRKLGVVDFDDLLLRTLALLENTTVLERARQQFDSIFVDEFQDTDRTQARIIEKLATDRMGIWVPGRTVVVGDPKQSIYGFRRADPETYRSVVGKMLGAGAEHRPIRMQYRSDPPLLEAINAIFTSLFANSVSDANVFRPQYTALRAGKRSVDRDLDARITFLHAKSEETAGRHEGEAEAVAEWILAHRDGSDRDLQRFAVLFRRLTKLDEYLDTFDRYGIDYVLPPTKAFLDRRAPVDLLAVLRAIAFPFDRGAEISAARTPYFALSDDEIAEGILEVEDGQHRPAYAAFRQAIDAYRAAAAHLTVSGIIDLLVSSVSIEAVYDALADGVRARRHLEHVRALAFEYDEKIGGSVRQFVAEIDRRREEPDEMEPSLADDDSNAVRILSVHAAKGLEFETVILPDLAFRTKASDNVALFAVEEPKSLVMTGRAQSLSAHFRFAAAQMRLKSIAGERDEAEMRRLFYVAVTRAKSEVVFVCNADPAGWKSDGFFKCVIETFGLQKDQLAGLWADEPSRRIEQKTIGTTVVPVAFERMHIRDVAERARQRLADASLQETLSGGALADPAITVPPPPAGALNAADAARAVARSSQRAVGTLLHRFLEELTGDADVNDLITRLAGETGAPESAVASVRKRYESLQRSVTFARIAAAETVGREIPIRFTAEDGTVVERRIDRLIRENGREVVVDYKSGKTDDKRLVADREQVEQYCRAVSLLTGRPCSGLLWYIDEHDDEAVVVAVNR
jgi:ATP-dependent helicase/nuclease subunit A